LIGLGGIVLHLFLHRSSESFAMTPAWIPQVLSPTHLAPVVASELQQVPCYNFQVDALLMIALEGPLGFEEILT
jgi:hypothetical protein